MITKFKKLISCMLVTTSMLSLAGCGIKQDVAQQPVAEETLPTASQIIAFGDSYSDNGEAYTISNAVIATGEYENAFIKPGDLYWENRYSTGKTAIEVAAELAGLPLVNFATGGATTGLENYTDWMDSLGNSGILGQINKFEMSLSENTQADENALYFIMGGTNDYCKFIDYALEGTVQDVANQTVKNLETAVRELAALGAKNFIVAEANDVSAMPYEITEGRGESAKEYALTVNTQLPEIISSLENELGIKANIFEITKITDAMIANPTQYGITEHINVIQPTWPQVLPAITEGLENYMYFDEWHPSATTHNYLGQGIYEVIKTFQ